MYYGITRQREIETAKKRSKGNDDRKIMMSLFLYHRLMLCVISGKRDSLCLWGFFT